jgi:hypothetical protein
MPMPKARSKPHRGLAGGDVQDQAACAAQQRGAQCGPVGLRDLEGLHRREQPGPEAGPGARIVRRHDVIGVQHDRQAAVDGGTVAVVQQHREHRLRVLAEGVPAFGAEVAAGVAAGGPFGACCQQTLAGRGRGPGLGGRDDVVAQPRQQQRRPRPCALAAQQLQEHPVRRAVGHVLQLGARPRAVDRHRRLRQHQLVEQVAGQEGRDGADREPRIALRQETQRKGVEREVAGFARAVELVG